MLELLESGGELRARLRENTTRFRTRMTELGFDVLPGDHPIVPIMYGDAVLAGRTAEAMLGARDLRDRVLLPGRPARARRGSARRCRPRTRPTDIDRAIAAFEEVRTAVPAG